MKRGNNTNKKGRSRRQEELEEGEEEEMVLPSGDDITQGYEINSGDESDKEATRQYLESLQPRQSQAPPFAAAMAAYAARPTPSAGVKRKEPQQKSQGQSQRQRFDRAPPPQNADREFELYKTATINIL